MNNGEEIVIRLRNDKYMKACSEIIHLWGYSSIEEFVREEVMMLVKTTLEANWDSLSEDPEKSRMIAQQIARKHNITS